MSAGWMKPVFRMAPEWAMLDDVTSKGFLEKYADSELDFFNDFASAFTKVLELTPQQDALDQCQAVNCVFDDIAKEFQCGGRKFPTDAVDCTSPSSGSCQIVQVIGTR